MKRLLSFVLTFILVILLLALSIYCILPKSNVSKNDDVELVLIYNERSIQVVLPDTEAKKIISILDGNLYDLLSGTPVCGFMKCYGFKIGDTFYAVAIDSCETIMDCSSDRYFYVSQEELNYIHDLFEKYDR